MGLNVYFYCGLRQLGSVHFSEFTLRRQNNAYGLDWGDCITFDHNGQEYIGDPSIETGPDHPSGRYAPLWDRGLERARRLLSLVQASKSEHRKEYDLPKVGQLVILLEKCATSELREYCQVEVT